MNKETLEVPKQTLHNTDHNKFKDFSVAKQETLEEKHIGHTINEFDKAYIKGFNKGAKWQQERSYSEEEVKDIIEKTIEKFYKHFYTLTKVEMKKQWFEQLKKK